MVSVVTLSPALPIHSQVLPGHNQETYRKLQSALLGSSPHQLYFAVCDDLPLQRQLAATLEASLSGRGRSASTRLTFVADNPDLGQQIRDWAHQTVHQNPSLLQVLGIEQLTYREADQQYRFLMSLHGLVPVWQQLECNLLIWLPRPWLKQVKRTVPTLCTKVFEFMGEPTPLSAIAAEQSHQVAFSPLRQWQFLDQPDQPVSETFPSQQGGQPLEAPARLTEAITIPAEAQEGGEAAEVAATAEELGSDVPTFAEDLWQHLQIDLDEFEGSETLSWHSLPAKQSLGTAARKKISAAQATSTSASSQHDDNARKIVIEDLSTPAADVSQVEIASEDLELWSVAYELRDRVQAGDRSLATLQAAIQQYESLLTARATPHRTEVLNDLGSLYWLWAQHATEVEIYQQRLIHSCELYESALSPLSPGTGGAILTRLHSNLGSVYSLLAALQEPTHHLNQAVRAFHRALQYVSVETVPTEYATLQTHLGTAYWSLAQHTNEAAHLHRAITAYQEALQQSHPQQMPQAYAQLQNNLGITLWSLSRHERPIFLLEQAISAYHSALAYRTLEAEPAGCAATHNNLGTAYWDLGGQHSERSQEQKQAWQQAIAAYETAISAAEHVPSASLGFDLWATHHSVGVVYDQLAIAFTPETEAQQPLLTRAISHYVKALIGWQTAGATTTETAFQAIVRNLHLQAQYLGVEVQQRSLGQIPADWLPDIWRKL